MRRTVAALATGVALGTCLTLPTIAKASPGDDPKTGRTDIPAWVTRPCHGAYDVNCRHENAQHVSIVRAVPGYVREAPASLTSSAGKGRSRTYSTHTVCVFYAQRAYARTHDYCD